MPDMLHPSVDLLALTNQFQMVRENLPGHHQSILPKEERKSSKNNIILKHNHYCLPPCLPLRKCSYYHDYRGR